MIIDLDMGEHHTTERTDVDPFERIAAAAGLALT